MRPRSNHSPRSVAVPPTPLKQGEWVGRLLYIERAAIRASATSFGASGPISLISLL